MKFLTDLATPGACRIMALTLVHFLWQGACVAAALAAVHALLPASRARARYGAACAAMALMVAIPVVTAWRVSAQPISAGGATVATRMDAAAPLHAGRDLLASAATPALPHLEALAPWIVLAWFAGVWALSVRLMAGVLQAGTLRTRHARPACAQWQSRLSALAAKLRMTRPVVLLESALVEVPTAIGILRPVVLLPVGLATGLSAGQIDSLLAHELAHVRRRDCLANLLQTLAETLLFYHPAVWWVSRRIRIEREHACDDLAIRVTGNRELYARALLDLEVRRQAAPRLAVAADGGRLWDRVARLFPQAERDAVRSPRWAAAALALASVLALGTAAAVPTVGAGGSTPTAATPAPTPAPAPSSPASAPAPASASSTPAPRSPVKKTAGQGGGLLSPDQLVAFKIHGVTPEFIDQVVALGYEKPSADDLVALRVLGVTPEYIGQMTKVFGRLPLDDYGALRANGLTPETAGELRKMFPKLSADDALAMRIHGVTPQFAADLRGLGLAELSADELVAFRIHGVTPEFVREIRGLGYTTIDADDLVAFLIHGVTPEYIRSLNQEAGRKLSADRLIERRMDGDPNEKERP